MCIHKDMDTSIQITQFENIALFAYLFQDSK